MAAQTTTQINLYNRFTPTGSQKRFLKSRAKGRLFSSGYGSGKSKTLCRESIRWSIDYPGSRNGIFRLTAEQLRKTTMVTFWKEMNQIGFKGGTPAEVGRGIAHFSHNKSEKELLWWNGSVTMYGHLEDAEEGLGSLELSSAAVDEGSQVPDSILSTLYTSRLRWHLPRCDHQEEVEAMISSGALPEEIAAIPCNCPRGMWVCTNPGASGYLKAVTEGRVDGWDWIPAKPGDNPYNGPDYYEQMERLREINGDVWMRRYYDGDWTAFEGARFSMFDRGRHIMDAPFTPSPQYEIVESWDFGHRETFVTWIAFNPSSNEPVVVFDELQVQEVNDPSDVARPVMAIRDKHRIGGRVRCFGDPAGVAANQFSSVSPIQAYAKLGIYIAPMKAGKNPQARADLLTRFLNENRIQPDGSIWPGIVFGPDCTKVVHSIQNLRWKPQASKIGEDGREQFVKKEDHGFDALSYGLCAVPPPDLSVEPPRAVAGVNLGARDAWKAGGDQEEWDELG